MNVRLFRRFVSEVIRLTGSLGRQRSVVANLTLTQCHILVEMRDQRLRHGDLAAILLVDSSTLTRTVGALVDQGLVRREPNPENRRETFLSLTPAGLEALAEIDRIMDARYAKLLSHIPPDRAAEVERSVELLLSLMREAAASLD